MKSQSLIPLIKIPTRVCPIFCCIPFVNSADQDKIRVKFRDFSSDNLNKLKIDVSQALENFNVFNSLPVEQQFDIFNDILLKCFDSR